MNIKHGFDHQQHFKNPRDDSCLFDLLLDQHVNVVEFVRLLFHTLGDKCRIQRLTSQDQLRKEVLD